MKGPAAWVREAWGRLRWRRRRVSRVEERLGRIEERLKEIEEEMGRREVTSEVWEREGGNAWRLDEGVETEEELAKGGGLESPRSYGGGLEALRTYGSLGSSYDNGSGLEAGSAMADDVRPGMPQGICGQRARHGAAQLWEGVL